MLECYIYLDALSILHQKNRLSFCELDSLTLSVLDRVILKNKSGFKVECGSVKSLAWMLQEWPWLVMSGHFGDWTVTTACLPRLTWPEGSRKPENHSTVLWIWPKCKENSQREIEVLSSVSPGSPTANGYLHSRAPGISKEHGTIWKGSSKYLLFKCVHNFPVSFNKLRFKCVK